MNENEPPSTLDYRSPELPAWSPAWRLPMGIIFPYSAGCGIGYAIGVLAAAWSTLGSPDFSRLWHGIANLIALLGIVSFAACVWMLFLTLIAVSLRMLLTPGPCVAARRRNGYLWGLAAGSLAGIAWIWVPGLAGKWYGEISGCVIPGAAAVAASVGLVRRAPRL